MNLKRKRNTVFYGWWIVGACILISVCSGGLIRYGFTAIFEPIANEFGWSYAQISLAAGIQGVEAGLLAPLMGLLVDRWGPRKLIFSGVIIFGLALMLLSRVSSLGMFYGTFILISVATSTTGHAVTMTAVGNWFRKRVGIALGILVSGFGLSGLLVPVMVGLIDVYGWRGAMFILGLGTWVIVSPLSLLVRHKPEQYGYVPDGESDNNAVVYEAQALTSSAKVDIGARQILTSGAFWYVALAFMCQALFVDAVVTHIIPYLSSIGIVRATSGLVASALPLVSIGGRLSFGWLGDRVGRRRISAAAFALTGLGLLLLGCATSSRIWLLMLFLASFGIGWGGNVVMRAALLRERFGRKRFGTALGFLIGVTHLGSISGPPLAGWVFDRWGSYQGIWFAFAVVSVVALVIVLTSPDFKNKTTD